MGDKLMEEAFHLAFLVCVILSTGQCTPEVQDENPRCVNNGGCERNQLQNLPFMISPEDFFSKFVFRHRPVLMRNGSATWPALKVWTDHYFMKAYKQGTTVPVVKGLLDIRKHPLHLSVDEFFHRYTLEDLTLVDTINSQMLHDVIVPLCLRCKHLMKGLQVSYWLRNHNKSRTALHVGAKEHLIAVVKGSLRVSLMSALYSEKLWSGKKPHEILENFNQGQSKNSMSVITVELQEGDILYVPQMWWKQLTVSDSLSILVHFEWPAKNQKAVNIPSFPRTGENFGDNLIRLGRLLRSYEESFLASELVQLQCPMQDRRMSEYVFETGKMSSEEYEKVHNGPDFRETEPCAFDVSNKDSPCKSEPCLEDPNAESCIRDVLNYCFEWEDRGCVEELPNLMNKMNGDTLRIKTFS